MRIIEDIPSVYHNIEDDTLFDGYYLYLLDNFFGQGNHPNYIRISQGCKIDQKDLVCKILKSL